jgi:hypothetical protein
MSFSAFTIPDPAVAWYIAVDVPMFDRSTSGFQMALIQTYGLVIA